MMNKTTWTWILGAVATAALGYAAYRIWERRKYSDVMAKAIDGAAEQFQCTAAALEFIDRGYYDFDLVDPMLHGLVMRKLPALIDASSGFSTEFLEYLYRFEDGQAYFQEDIRRRLVRHPNASTSIRDDFYSKRD